MRQVTRPSLSKDRSRARPPSVRLRGLPPARLRWALRLRCRSVYIGAHSHRTPIRITISQRDSLQVSFSASLESSPASTSTKISPPAPTPVTHSPDRIDALVVPPRALHTTDNMVLSACYALPSTPGPASGGVVKASPQALSAGRRTRSHRPCRRRPRSPPPSSSSAVSPTSIVFGADATSASKPFEMKTSSTTTTATLVAPEDQESNPTEWCGLDANTLDSTTTIDCDAADQSAVRARGQPVMRALFGHMDTPEEKEDLSRWLSDTMKKSCESFARKWCFDVTEGTPIKCSSSNASVAWQWEEVSSHPPAVSLSD